MFLSSSISFRTGRPHRTSRSSRSLRSREISIFRKEKGSKCAASHTADGCKNTFYKSIHIFSLRFNKNCCRSIKHLGLPVLNGFKPIIESFSLCCCQRRRSRCARKRVVKGRLRPCISLRPLRPCRACITCGSFCTRLALFGYGVKGAGIAVGQRHDDTGPEIPASWDAGWRRCP